MNNTLERFFNKIDFNERENFNTVKVDKVIVNNKKETWTIMLSSPKVVPVKDMLSLISTCEKGLPGVNTIFVKIKYDEITPDDVLSYFNYYLDELIKTNPSLISLSDTSVVIEENTINIDVISSIEESFLKSQNEKFNKWSTSLGLNECLINPQINDQKREEIKTEIASGRVDVVTVKEPEFKVIMGETIKSKTITDIKDIMGEENNVTVEAYVFGTEEFVSSKSNFQILTLKISDKTDSIMAKIFTREEEDFNKYKGSIKENKWYRFRGYIKNDAYAKELVFNIRDIEEIPSKDEKFVDNAEEKRVELHAHTMMSQMDAVTKFDLDKRT